MIDIKTEKEDYILRIPKVFFNYKKFQSLLDTLEIEKALENSQLTEEQAWTMSEEIKEEWWKENRARFLKGIV